LYHPSNASYLRSSPLPGNFLGDGTLIPSLGNGSSAGAAPPAPLQWSGMSSESLLLLALSGSPAGTATGALLDDSFCGDSSHLPGVTVIVFASSVADSARSRCSLSLASCLAVPSIENCSFAGALTNRPCSSQARS